MMKDQVDLIRIGAEVVCAVAKYLKREPDDELAAALASHYTISQSETERAATASEIPPTLAYLRARLTSNKHEGIDDNDFDAIVQAAVREHVKTP